MGFTSLLSQGQWLLIVTNPPSPFYFLPPWPWDTLLLALRPAPSQCSPPHLPTETVRCPPSTTIFPDFPTQLPLQDQPSPVLRPSPLTVPPLLLMAIVLRSCSTCSGAWTKCFRLLWAHWGQGSYVILLCEPSPTVSPVIAPKQLLIDDLDSRLQKCLWREHWIPCQDTSFDFQFYLPKSYGCGQAPNLFEFSFPHL